MSRLEGISEADQATLTAAHATPGPYTLGPESTEQDGVPRGELTKHRWTSEPIYPGVERDYWVYVPRQYDGTKPACLMVFQDALLYLGPDANVPVAFDNLIHKGDMPADDRPVCQPRRNRVRVCPRWGGTDNRSVEYDSLGDRYVRFLLEELLPPIERQYKIVG